MKKFLQKILYPGFRLRTRGLTVVEFIPGIGFLSVG